MKIYNDYREILDIYPKIETCNEVSRPYFINKILNRICFYVKENKFNLYGNIFNNRWRYANAYSNSYPLHRFDLTFLEDAIGHLSKNRPKSDYYDYDKLKFSLVAIRQIIRDSLNYKLEELIVKIEKLKAENLNLDNKLSKANSRIHYLESQLNK